MIHSHHGQQFQWTNIPVILQSTGALGACSHSDPQWFPAFLNNKFPEICGKLPPILILEQ